VPGAKTQVSPTTATKRSSRPSGRSRRASFAPTGTSHPARPASAPASSRPTRSPTTSPGGASSAPTAASRWGRSSADASGRRASPSRATASISTSPASPSTPERSYFGRDIGPSTNAEKRQTGVEPASSAWKAEALPLSYCRAPGGSVAMIAPIRQNAGALLGEWRSLVAHSAGGRAVAGSNPVSPIACLAPHRPARRTNDLGRVSRGIREPRLSQSASGGAASRHPSTMRV
jgi:hypothetical protein